MAPSSRAKTSGEERARKRRQSALLSAFRRMNKTERRDVLIALIREFDPAPELGRNAGGDA